MFSFQDVQGLLGRRGQKAFVGKAGGSGVGGRGDLCGHE